MRNRVNIYASPEALERTFSSCVYTLFPPELDNRNEKILRNLYDILQSFWIIESSMPWLASEATTYTLTMPLPPGALITHVNNEHPTDGVWLNPYADADAVTNRLLIAITAALTIGLNVERWIVFQDVAPETLCELRLFATDDENVSDEKNRR